MTRGERPRTGLRTEDRHASWQEVYAALDVDTGQHERDREQDMYQSVPNTLDAETGAKATQDR